MQKGKYVAIRSVPTRMGICAFTIPEGCTVEVIQVDGRNNKVLVKCGSDIDWMSDVWLNTSFRKLED